MAQQERAFGGSVSSGLVRRFKWMLPVALVLGVLFVTPFGRWMASAAWPGFGTQNAYEAFGQWNWVRPDAKPLDPMARAELEMIDERLATQLAGRSPIHPPGSLVTLEYTTVGANGEELDQWHVRAIVPVPDNVNEPDLEAWTARVPEIESRLQQQGGMILHRSGTTGLPPEAVLRLRTGEAIEIEAPEGFVTVDFLDGATYRIHRRAFSLANGSVSAPTQLRVGLVEACAADVRVGRLTKMEFAPFAIIPIPTGFQERRWVQMTGCKPPAIVTGSGLSSPSPRAGESERPGAPLLAIARDGSLHILESSLQAENRPLQYRIDTVCRFDAEQDRWQVLFQAPRSAGLVVLAPLPANTGATAARVVARLPPVALYWLRWSEGLEGADVISLRSRHDFGYVGGMLCNDVDLGPAPAGKVAICIPYADRAEARFVPDPVLACAARRTP